MNLQIGLMCLLPNMPYKKVTSKTNFNLVKNKKCVFCLSEKEIKQRILTDPDFIWSRKYSFSLKKLLKKEKIKLTDKTIAQFLKLTLDEFDSIYNNIIYKLKSNLSIN